jgi:hypothetical protein
MSIILNPKLRHIQEAVAARMADGTAYMHPRERRTLVYFQGIPLERLEIHGYILWAADTEGPSICFPDDMCAFLEKLYQETCRAVFDSSKPWAEHREEEISIRYKANPSEF